MRKFGVILLLVFLVLTLCFVNLYAAPVVVGNFTIDYVIQSDWGTGATINVTLKNNGPAINGWTVGWTFPGNQTITNMWNGTYLQTGAAVSVKDAGFNASIATGGSTSFGFNANYSGTNAAPTSFTVNSSSTTTPTPTSRQTPTPSATTTPTRGGTPTPTRGVTATPTRRGTITPTPTSRRNTPIPSATPLPSATTAVTPSPTRTVTVTPTPTQVQGMPNPVFSGDSYDLTGSNYFQSPALNISGNQPWTMAGWVYQRGTSDEKDPGYQYYRPNPNYVSKCVMGWGSSGTKTANCLYVNPVKMNFEYGFDSSSVGTAPNYSHYTWYHVANTYDGNTQRIYINGNLVASRTPGTLNLANTALVIGRDPASQNRNLTGKVQQVKIYNTALTATQVSSLVTTLPTPLNGYGISTAIPSALSFLDTSFYKKCYKTPLGVYIISSNRVGDHSLVVCGQQIDTIMAGVKARYPAVYTSMLNSNCRVVIQSYMEQTTDVPEWKNLTNALYARGMGGINGSPFSGCGEENVHHESFCAYRNENIIVHEFGHSLQGHGLYNGARAVYDEIRNAYNEAVSKGLWVNTYPGSNFNEYFANAVQTWYNVAAQSSSGQPDGTHNHVNLRSELQTYDPRLYNALASLLDPGLLPEPWMVSN